MIRKDYHTIGVVQRVAVDNYVTVVRWVPFEHKHPRYDVYLQGVLVLDGLRNYQAGSIGKVLCQADGCIKETEDD